jgi:hypothetical protein
VEHSGDTNSCTEMLRIGGDLKHRLAACVEQQFIDRRLFLEADLIDREVFQESQEAKIGRVMFIGASEKPNF